LAKALGDAQPFDIIILSDVDEIPSKAAVARLPTVLKTPAHVACFDLRAFYYFVNLEHGEIWSRIGPRAARKAGVTSIQALREVRGRHPSQRRDLVRWLRACIFQRRWVRRVTLANAGWHFSWLGSIDDVAQKARSISVHSNLPNTMAKRTGAAINILKYIQSEACKVVEIDETFPAELRLRQADWDYMVLDNAKRADLTAIASGRIDAQERSP
jgi:beta-1,4-mannosyl-glycoprotein beta-1,4-N-acetylglucosaminyltransferase